MRSSARPSARLIGAPIPLGSHAFLGAAAARPMLRFPVSLVSTAGPRAHPLPARCGTQFDSRHRESERRPPLRLRYASSPRGMGLLRWRTHGDATRLPHLLRASARSMCIALTLAWQHFGVRNSKRTFDARPKEPAGLSAKSVHRRRVHFPRGFTEAPIQTEKDFLSAEERHSPRRPDGSDSGHSHWTSSSCGRRTRRCSGRARAHRACPKEARRIPR